MSIIQITRNMTPIVLFVFLSRFLGAVDLAWCGGHAAPTCNECGPTSWWCNGHCEWSVGQQTCVKPCCSNPISQNIGTGEVTLPLVIGFDLYFSKQFGGNKGAIAAINKIIMFANKRFGESNLKPAVKLVVNKLYPVNLKVSLTSTGDLDTMPDSLRGESVRKGVPFVLITGKGGMSGKASGSFCLTNRVRHTWALSSCHRSAGEDLEWCANPLVHEIGHLIGMAHDVDVGCPNHSGHMSGNHHKWSSCSNRQWQNFYNSYETCTKRNSGIEERKMETDWIENNRTQEIVSSCLGKI